MSQEVVTGIGGGAEEQKKALFPVIPDPNELKLYALSPADEGLTKENLAAEATNIITSIINNSGGGVAGHNTEIQYNKNNSFGANPAFTLDPLAGEPLDIASPAFIITGNNGKIGFYGHAGNAISSLTDGQSGSGTFYIEARNSALSEDGQSLQLTSGGSTDANAGNLFAFAGNAPSGIGGSVVLAFGQGLTLGDVYILDIPRECQATFDLSLITDGFNRRFKFPDKDGTFALTSDATTPGGSDTQIQFNDSGSFNGSSNLAWNKTFNQLILTNVEQQFLAGTTMAGKIFESGGVFYFQGQDDVTGTGDGFSTQIASGWGGSSSGNAGDITLLTGETQAGNSNGGSIILIPSAKSGSGTDGAIQFQDENSGINAVFSTAPLASSDKTFTFPNQTGTFTVGTASVDLTAQTAAKTTTTLFTPSVTGMYRVSVYLQVTTAGGVSSVLGGATGVVITYNDGDGNVAQTDTVGLTAPNGTIVTTLSTNTTATNLSGSLEIYAKTGVAITYAIGYTSVGTAMQYAAHLRCEAI